MLPAVTAVRMLSHLACLDVGEIAFRYESELQVAQGHGDMLGAVLESDSDDEGPG